MTDMRDAFFDTLGEIAKADENVVCLFADMGAWSLNKCREDMPDRFINVGISEQNMVSVAAGLAITGKRVFLYTIIPFLVLRCLEQIKVDLCGMKLPITLVGSGPGFSYGSDGYTHHAVEDVGIVRALGSVSIFNPSDAATSEAAARFSYVGEGPSYVRIDKGKYPDIHKDGDLSGGVASIYTGSDVVILSTGVLVHEAIKIREQLAALGIDAGVVDVFRLHPLNEAVLLDLMQQAGRVVTFEEHAVVGGLGSAVAELLVDRGERMSLERIGVRPPLCERYGSREWLREFYGLDADAVTRMVRSLVQEDSANAVGSVGLISQSPGDKDDLRTLGVDDFVQLFGLSLEDVSAPCRQAIEETDFTYGSLSADERDGVIADSLRSLDAGTLTTSGPHRKAVWEEGWAENLREFDKSEGDPVTLVPRFVRRQTVKRLCGEYIRPTNAGFESCFVDVFRTMVLGKYFKDVDSIFEFGCGSGHNLLALAKMFPDKELHGLDWAQSSCEIIDRLVSRLGLRLHGELFDMFHPDESIELGPKAGIFTIGAMEQLGVGYEEFLSFLLRKQPKICINVETMNEIYTNDTLEDYITLRYTQLRGYLWGFLDRLRACERDGLVRIHSVRRTFGSQFHEGYSFVVWEPLERGSHGQ